MAASQAPRAAPKRTSAAAVVASTLAWLVVLTVPLLGTWLAASLAAYGHRGVWPSLLAGFVVFPVVPVVWEVASTLHGDKKRWLETRDRLVLRTLAVSLAFLAVLLVAFPKTAFTALSTRGDFLFDGRSGAFADRGRSVAHGAARGLEWLYLLTRDRPFDTSDEAPEPVPTAAPSTVPTPTPVPSSTPSAAPSATPLPSTSATPPEPVARPKPTWPDSDDKLSPVVTTMPQEAEATPETIGAYIAAHAPTQLGRARAVHDYVADRIAYDGPSYRAGLYPPQDAASVLKRRVGVCAGYARLFAAIAKASGLEAKYVVGTVRGADMRPDGESHAWNAVKIEGAWYLVDTTWDAGYLEGATFVKRTKVVYFATPPEVFRVDHFPDETAWQLADKPIDRGEFFRRPMTSAELYADGLELREPDRSQVSTTGPFTVELENPRGLYMIVSDAKVHCAVTRSGTRVTGTCPVEAKGAHRVELFASKVQYGTYHYVGHIDVTRL